ncbi:SDR family NAD(P)-dependent oxidoreductase [Sphingomonas solaris]|nr:glucose 1-dehydrogenase [Sphingomonas solaris]
MRLAGRTALITGAAGGIGRAIALAYAAQGAHALCADRSGGGTAETVLAVRDAGGHATGIDLDVTDDRAIDDTVTAAMKAHGAIDILANCAGIAASQPLLEITRESFQRVLDVNLIGLFFTLQAVARTMVQRGVKGRIVNIASVSGRRGEPGALQYGASKAGVVSVTQSAALALAPHGITVNAIAPGFIDTGMWRDARDRIVASGALGDTGATVDAAMARSIPLGRLGEPADLAGIALLLSGDEGAYITGQTYNVDGGLLAG